MSTLYWEPVEDENGQLIDVVPVKPPESDEEKKTALKNHLEELDRQAIRPLRAIAAGNDTEEDREILADLGQQAAELRERLAALENYRDEQNTNRIPWRRQKRSTFGLQEAKKYREKKDGKTKTMLSKTFVVAFSHDYLTTRRQSSVCKKGQADMLILSEAVH